MAGTVPIPDSYWLVDDWLLAGEYPGAYLAADARARLQRFLAAGIRSFIDLTEEDEPLEPYDDLLLAVAQEAGVDCSYQRFPIPDLDVPSNSRMQAILDAIRHELQAGRPVYVHCYGGIGRTGTVAGCWLIEQGMQADDALTEIANLRVGTPDGLRPSPETWDQRDFIRRWQPRTAAC